MPLANKILDPQKFLKAKARPRVSKLNKTEQRYADYLEFQLRGGMITAYYAQAITLKLGDDCRYTPDFMYVESDGGIVFIEVKGFLRDDALVKFRAAQEKFWWARFVMVQWKDGAFKKIRD